MDLSSPHVPVRGTAYLPWTAPWTSYPDDIPFGAALAAVPVGDRAVWATAMYAGLRLGELRALRWEDVDLANGSIRVERSWDPKTGPVAPKSQAGLRTVPVCGALHDALVEHREQLLTQGHTRGLFFGRTSERPFNPTSITARATRSWRTARLGTITLHECRHTCASTMMAAGVPIKAVSTYMGHSSIAITFDRYGHLLPGSANEAAGLIDTFLRREPGAGALPSAA